MVAKSISKKQTGPVAKILVVDDEELIRNCIAEVINILGHEDCNAENGQDALEQLAGNSIDIVITDIHMPGMDGIQLLRHIKDRHPHVDVLVTTGSFGKYGVAEINEEGAADYLPKPFDIKELQTKLNRVLNERKAVRDFTGQEHLDHTYVPAPNFRPWYRSAHQRITSGLTTPNLSDFRI